MKWKEFKPTIFFLLKFLSIYIVCNLLYGIFVTAYEPRADPLTKFVTEQTAQVLSAMGWPTETFAYTTDPTVAIVYQKRAIVSVYEGCNGINVVIIFLAFLFSFGPYTRAMLWFIPMGVMLVHLSNLTRIMLLFFVSLKFPNHLYFLHKYFFTSFIYACVFLLWILWIRKISKLERDV